MVSIVDKPEQAKDYFMKDKFEIGNVLLHVPSKSRWIITERMEINYKDKSFWRMKVKAFCVSVQSTRARYAWKINTHAIFMLQDKDLNPKDKLWKVLYEK